MPWTADSFRSKHNKSLSDHQASVAARVANAALKRGKSDKDAIIAGNVAARNAKRIKLKRKS